MLRLHFILACVALQNDVWALFVVVALPRLFFTFSFCLSLPFFGLPPRSSLITHGRLREKRKEKE